MPELTATLIINITDSRCGNCGEATLLRDRQGEPITHHADVSGYSPVRGGGCGARFIDTRSECSAITPDDLRSVRPDLPVRTSR